MSTRDAMLAAARGAVVELAVEDAAAASQSGARTLIDIREDDERASGSPEGALGIPRSFLELRLGDRGIAPEQPLALLCAGGLRSLLAAQALQQLGYRDVASVAGGFDAWKAAGLPVARGDADDDWLDRYSRHLRLSDIGEAGQRRLQASRVMVIGAGGLGSPALFYLAAAGVGFLRLVDDDRVERSNLQRQILHVDARVGMAKAESARVALAALNPRIRIDARAERLAADNVDALLGDVDVVIDGSDNLVTRYLVSDACVRLAKPLVYAAVHRFEGQLAVFDAGRQRGVSPCYRCLFPLPPERDAAPNCAEVGVLGVVPGMIGLLQANEAFKLLLGLGEVLDQGLLSVDLLSLQFRRTRLRPDPDCPACGRGGELVTPDVVCRTGG
jgi:sulfur-carrier protein adenylyltransferase/sulfurtransferase